MDKIKNWLFDEIMSEDDANNKIILDEYKDINYDILLNINDSFKNDHIVLCILNEKDLIRILDYMMGICFILNYQHITINKYTHLFIPQYISYNPNS